MEWYEKKVGFHRDPKCRALRVRLKNPLAECYVERIYCYCYEQEQDRFDGLAAVGTLEDAAEWRGKTGALVTALIEEGFIDRDGTALVVHGVASRLAKAHLFRERAAERKERWRLERDKDPQPGRDGNAKGTPPERVPSKVPTNQTNQTDRSSSLSGLEAGRKPAAKRETDPRFDPIRSAWEAEFRALTGSEYRWSPADSVGVHRVIAVPVEEFARRAKLGLRSQGWLRCGTVAKLTSNEVWNQLACPSGVAPRVPVTAPASPPEKFAVGGARVL